MSLWLLVGVTFAWLWVFWKLMILTANLFAAACREDSLPDRERVS